MTSAQTKEAAQVIWQAMNPSEKHGVKFGLFPATVMQDAEKAGHDGHALACALMDLSNQNGGRHE